MYVSQYLTKKKSSFDKTNQKIIFYLNFMFKRWKYKEEYEKFKYYVTMISMFLSFLLLVIKPLRVLDAVLNFLLVWYYCTLTIRESILVINGSKINGWWQAHHFITTVCVAIFLIW